MRRLQVGVECAMHSVMWVHMSKMLLRFLILALILLTISTAALAQDGPEMRSKWRVSTHAEGEASPAWRNAMTDSLRLLIMQHMLRMAQARTRDEFGGPFFKDYHRSVRIPNSWGDGDGWLINYVGHPIQGAATGFIWVANDPRSRRDEFGFNRDYWTTRWRALAWSTGYSLQFEFGLLSEASIGNVGLNRGTIGWTDHVITPLGGTAWMVAEDAIDRFLVRWVERRTRQPLVRIVARMVFNPSRSVANVAQGAAPWHRDARGLRRNVP